MIIIVGSGLAGFITGVVPVKQGIPVTILEKMDRFGGNSIKASSGINLVNSQLQNRLGIKDSVEQFLEDTVKSCESEKNSEYDLTLVKLLATYSSKVEELWNDIGVEFDQVTMCGGHSVARTHRNSKQVGIGYYLIKSAHDYFLKLGGNIIYNATVNQLVVDNFRVVGVKTLSGEIYYGDKVVLATGGYERSLKYLSVYNKDVLGKPTTAGSHCLGDGLDIATSIGANLVGMNHIQLHPTGIVDPKDEDNMTKFLAPEAIRAVGGKLYSMDNVHLGHELETRDKVTSIIEKQPDAKAKLVLDKEASSKIQNVVNFYKGRGLAFTEQNDKLITFIVTPVIHYTMGGLQINGNGQVINHNGNIIDGLYAVGEVTGGVHGSNRLAGNSLLECCVFGIIVGMYKDNNRKN